MQRKSCRTTSEGSDADEDGGGEKTMEKEQGKEKVPVEVIALPTSVLLAAAPPLLLMGRTFCLSRETYGGPEK